MRASGSNSVSLSTKCTCQPVAVRGGFPVGRRDRVHGAEPDHRLCSTPRPQSASPRAAHDGVHRNACIAVEPQIAYAAVRRLLAAENAIDLSAMPGYVRPGRRAASTLSRTALGIDCHGRRRGDGRLFAEVQAAKTFVDESAGPDRGSGARARGRRRLHEPPPSLAGVPRRPRLRVHAAPERQPRLRVHRARRPRRAGRAPVSSRDSSGASRFARRLERPRRPVTIGAGGRAPRHDGRAPSGRRPARGARHQRAVPARDRPGSRVPRDRRAG